MLRKMVAKSLVFISLLVTKAWGGEVQLPSWFKFGVASSAYQTEGGWNASGKSENVWDHSLHANPELVEGNIDVACDSYHHWQRDIEMLKELNVQMYRFSIAWTRLLPNATNIVNEDGKNYYNNLIDALLAEGIEPVVTIYHYDLPQWIQDLGGWANPLSADWFAQYARVVFSLFGDRVTKWFTINEPFATCEMGYSNKSAPYINDTIGRFLCNKHILLAHAKAYRLYQNEFKEKYDGIISIVSVIDWMIPASPEDVAVTNLTMDYWTGRYTYPIYSEEGGWPPVLEAFLAQAALDQGCTSLVLPPFTDTEKELIRGSHDSFFAFNYYSSRLVSKANSTEAIGDWPFDGCRELGITFANDPTWDISDAEYLPVYPEGIRLLLNYLQKAYNISQFLITENGFRSTNSSLNDFRTIDYIKRHLEQVELAIQDGVNVTGYNYWSLLDNFEGGYGTFFGLFKVDFSDGNRTRTPRASARYYSEVARTKSLSLNFTNVSY